MEMNGWSLKFVNSVGNVLAYTFEMPKTNTPMVELKSDEKEKAMKTSASVTTTKKKKLIKGVLGKKKTTSNKVPVIEGDSPESSIPDIPTKRKTIKTTQKPLNQNLIKLDDLEDEASKKLVSTKQPKQSKSNTTNLLDKIRKPSSARPADLLTTANPPLPHAPQVPQPVPFVQQNTQRKNIVNNDFKGSYFDDFSSTSSRDDKVPKTHIRLIQDSRNGKLIKLGGSESDEEQEEQRNGQLIKLTDEALEESMMKKASLMLKKATIKSREIEV